MIADHALARLTFRYGSHCIMPCASGSTRCGSGRCPAPCVPTLCVQLHVLGRLCCQQPDALAAAGQQMCCAADSCLGGAGLGAVFWAGASSTDPLDFAELLGHVALSIGSPDYWAAAGDDEHPSLWRAYTAPTTAADTSSCGACGPANVQGTVGGPGRWRLAALRCCVVSGKGVRCLGNELQSCLLTRSTVLASSCIGNAFSRVSKALWMLYML